MDQRLFDRLVCRSKLPLFPRSFLLILSYGPSRQILLPEGLPTQHSSKHCCVTVDIPLRLISRPSLPPLVLLMVNVYTE